MIAIALAGAFVAFGAPYVSAELRARMGGTSDQAPTYKLATQVIGGIAVYVIARRFL